MMQRVQLGLDEHSMDVHKMMDGWMDGDIAPCPIFLKIRLTAQHPILTLFDLL